MERSAPPDDPDWLVLTFKEGNRMIEKRSLEEALAELDGILRRYHLGSAAARSDQKLTHQEALTGLRKLGFTVGEALRLLRPKGGQ